MGNGRAEGAEGGRAHAKAEAETAAGEDGGVYLRAEADCRGPAQRPGRGGAEGLRKPSGQTAVGPVGVTCVSPDVHTYPHACPLAGKALHACSPSG